MVDKFSIRLYVLPMTYLKMRAESTYHIDYSDLEDFIKQTYNMSFEVVCAEEAGNDTTLSYLIDGKIPSYFEEDLDKFKNTGQYRYGMTRILLSDLCRNNRIPVGHYIINISW